MPVFISRSLLALLAFGLLLESGCGRSDRPSLLPAAGTVKLNGEPLAGAVVAFEPIVDAKASFRRPANAVTDAQGRFSLSTYEKDDGIPAGKYRVAIVKREMIERPENFNEENPNMAGVKYQWITPKGLADPATSGLQAEVSKSGLKPDLFDLHRDGPPEVEAAGVQRKGNEP